MAVGDITAVRIISAAPLNGWDAEVDISGLSTGGTYAIGMTGSGDNWDASTSKLVFTVTSLGFDATGGATTLVRYVYGTFPQRKAYPNNAVNDESAAGGTVTVRVSLSDYIFASDTVTVAITAGFYTEGGNPNNAYSGAVTNSSSQAYPKVVGNWTYPGWTVVGTSFKVRMIGGHISARNDAPLRCVIFTVTDGTNTVTTTVTSLTIDSTIPDASKVVEYIGTISTSTLTDGAQLTANFKAYPWYGDAASVLDTSDAVNTMPTPYYAPQYYLLDYTGTTVTRKCAVVDSVSGVNGTGVVINFSAFNPSTPPSPFLNIYYAVNAIRTAMGGVDISGAVIYLRSTGTHVWMGGVLTADITSTKAWVEFLPFPGETPEIADVLTSKGLTALKIHAKGMKISVGASSTVFYPSTYLWVEGVNSTTTTEGIGQANQIMYITGSSFAWVKAFPYSTVVESLAIVRGNTYTLTATTTIEVFTFIGNVINGTYDLSIRSGYGASRPKSREIIIAFNKWWKIPASSIPIYLYNSTGDTIGNGCMVAQNLIECTSTYPNMQLSDGVVDNINNVLLWNNTFSGNRQNLGYDSGTGLVRKFWSMRNNLVERNGTVIDIDLTHGGPNAAWVGNWPFAWGVSSGCNYVTENGTTSDLARLQLMNGFWCKVGSYGGAIDPLWVDNNSTTGDATGNGDYHLQATSPAKNMVRSGMAIFPFDLDGVARRNDGTGAVGAYEFPSGSAGNLVNRGNPLKSLTGGALV